MTHYDITAWVDYVRGLGEPGARAAMQQHVRDGCSTCGATRDALAQLAAAVTRDEACEPPPGVVRDARALFARFTPERVRRLPRLLARLVQDSLLEPLPVGVRANERASRQALYEAGEVFLDLRLEQRPGASAVALVGQLMSQEEAPVPVARRSVVLTSGREVLTTTVSNEHGEFHLEYDPAGQVRLHIPVEEGARQIEIALNPLLPRATARSAAAGAKRPRPVHVKKRG